MLDHLLFIHSEKGAGNIRSFLIMEFVLFCYRLQLIVCFGSLHLSNRKNNYAVSFCRQ